MDEAELMSEIDYFSDLRHDLANPINQIIGFTELIEEDLSDGLSLNPEDLGKIRTAAHVLQGLVKTRVRPHESLSIETTPLENAESTSPKPIKAELKDDLDSLPGTVDSKSPRKGTVLGKVLAVDDDNFNLEILAKFLCKQGYLVTTAEDGIQALCELEKGDYDLVLLDVMMPNLDGLETLKRIRQQESLAATPVIMISALDELSSVVKCVEAGAEDYLPKPYNATLLRARIGSCLQRKAWIDKHLHLIEKLEISQASIDAGLKASTVQLDLLAGQQGNATDFQPLRDAFARMSASLVGQKRQIAETINDLQIEINRKQVSAQVKSIVSNPEFASLGERAQAMRERRRQREMTRNGTPSATMDDV
jgi:sigma-B regulation protein RsbU (phosphoserine phosphatase)